MGKADGNWLIWTSSWKAGLFMTIGGMHQASVQVDHRLYGIQGLTTRKNSLRESSI